MTDLSVEYDAPPAVVMKAIRGALGNLPPPVRVSKNGKRIGRPPRIYPALVDSVCELISRGATIEDAAQAVGVGRATFHSWKSRGQDARALRDNAQTVPDTERAYLDFLDRIEQAGAVGSVSVAQKLRELAMGQVVTSVTLEETEEGERVRRIEFAAPSVRALTFMLERRYGWNTKVEVGGPAGGPIPVEVEVSARDAIRKRLDQVAARLGETG